MALSASANFAVRVVLSAIPFAGVCGVVPLVNRVTPYVLGLPFFVFWVALWTVLTSACMAAVFLLDPVRGVPARRGEPDRRRAELDPR
jgi:hypothetical protein